MEELNRDIRARNWLLSMFYTKIVWEVLKLWRNKNHRGKECQQQITRSLQTPVTKWLRRHRDSQKHKERKLIEFSVFEIKGEKSILIRIGAWHCVHTSPSVPGWMNGQTEQSREKPRLVWVPMVDKSSRADWGNCLHVSYHWRPLGTWQCLTLRKIIQLNSNGSNWASTSAALLLQRKTTNAKQQARFLLMTAWREAR